MARVCELTGVKPHAGNNVSHAVNRSKNAFYPESSDKENLGSNANRFITIKATARAFRTLDKKGFSAFKNQIVK